MGPTASGKSDIAIRLAQDFNGEVISADSRQVYRGMDIGAGKVKGRLIRKGKYPFFLSEGVKHYMIDIVSPLTNYNVAKYKKKAIKILDYILEQRKLPIICGGTGFWIKAIVDNIYIPPVKPDWSLRKKLAALSTDQLYSVLEEKDLARAKKIDKNNRVRIIRALEICKRLGRVPLLKTCADSYKKYKFLQIGVSWPKDILAERIRNRLEARFRQGMVDEVKKLHECGITWKRLKSFGLEYKWVSKYLKGEIEFEKMKEQLYYAIKHYAKRQMVWFKKDKRIIWINDYPLIYRTVKNFVETKPS